MSGDGRVRRVEGRYHVFRAVPAEDDRGPIRTTTRQTADHTERNTRTRPTLQTRSNARWRNGYESNADIRERQIQQEWSDRQRQLPTSFRTEPRQANGIDPSNSAVLEGQFAYREWSESGNL